MINSFGSITGHYRPHYRTCVLRHAIMRALCVTSQVFSDFFHLSSVWSGLRPQASSIAIFVNTRHEAGTHIRFSQCNECAVASHMRNLAWGTYQRHLVETYLLLRGMPLYHVKQNSITISNSKSSIIIKNANIGVNYWHTWVYVQYVLTLRNMLVSTKVGH